MFQVLKDFHLTDTPFRGLILRGPLSLLAYVGVPQSHWLADMEGLAFDCHHGVTFSGPGDGVHRPAGWYWYGWDYAHYVDHIEMPPEMRAHLEEAGLDLDILDGKRWTIEEVEHDIIDAGISLMTSIRRVEAQTARAIDAKTRQR